MSEKIRSRSRSETQTVSSLHNFNLLLSAAFYRDGNANIENIRNQSGVSRLYFSHEPNIQDFNHGIVYIYDDSMQAIQNTIGLIIDQIIEVSKQDQFSIIIFISKDSIGAVIGTREATIKYIQKTTNAEITIKREQSDNQDKQVKIAGSYQEICSAIQQIYKIVQKFQKDQVKQEVQARLLFNTELIGFIIGKNETWNKDVQFHQVSIKFFSDNGPPCRRDESMCLIRGHQMQEFQDINHKIFEQIEGYANNHRIRDVNIYLLVPSKSVNRLIGQSQLQFRRNLIKETTQHSQTCYIKVISDKSADQKRSCVVKQIYSLSKKAANNNFPEVGVIQAQFSRKALEFSFKNSKTLSPKLRVDQRNLDKSSYMDRNGDIKICINIVVPNQLVAIIIGRNCRYVKDIVQHTGTTVIFLAQEECTKIRTPEGQLV